MERDSFVFYRSFLAGIDVIQDEAEQLKAYKYIIRYGVYGEEPEEKNSIAYGFFAMAKPQIDANNKRFVDGQKGGQFGHLGGAPKGNSNAVKDWEKVSKQPQRGSKDNPSGVTKTTPNVNVNVNVNDNVNDNEKKCEEKHEASTFDANASHLDVEKRDVGKNNESMKLNDRLKTLGLEDEVIELAMTYDSCKKGKKLSKFKDAQLKIRVDKLRRCGFNEIDGMKQVLENSIAGGYEGIFELKTKPLPKQKIEEGKVVNVNGANIFF